MATILIIDDDVTFRQTLRLNLEHADYCIVEAGNGVDGMQSFRSCLPNLVIMDISMPQLDGVQAIEAILSEYPETKILAVSGTPRYASARLDIARNAGAADALQKPFSRDTLLRSIHTLLNDAPTPAKALTKVAESVRKIF